jgi:pimeloyl-ACP methyl ester carboxylesterase
MLTKIPMRDLIVTLPGILGSVLQKDGKDLWARSGRSIVNMIKDRDGMLADLQLDQDDPDAMELGDGIKATRFMEDVTIVPGFFKVEAYTQPSKMIIDYFDVVVGDIYNDPWDRAANFYRFPYDWRRDNRANAKILKHYLDRRLHCWRNASGNPEAKVILLAHSMGGLVSRYYLEVLEGWRDAKALFTCGTPYRGAVNAVSFVSNGYKGRLLDFSETVRSMTSAYQLMPIYEMLKRGDRYYRVAELDNIPNVSQARAQDALVFHREIEAAVTAHLKEEAYRSFTTVPIAGIQQPTPQSAELVNGKLVASETLPAVLRNRPDLVDGDGTVPQVSAFPIELSNSLNTQYIAEKHSSLQGHAQILEDIRERLSVSQFDASSVRAPQGAISVSLDDAYWVDEPIVLRSRLLGNAALTATGVTAEITAVSGEGKSIGKPLVQTAEGDWELAIELPIGVYRVTVAADGEGVSAVHDVFEVMG